MTFKWSRDNGVSATKITNIPPDDNKLTVSGSGRDKLLGFASGQWVEIIDDRNELLCTPGTLVQLTGVNEGVNKNDENDLIYDPDSVNGQVPLNSKNFPQELNPKVRRWDTDTNSETGNIKVKIIADNNAGYIQLEDGVEVKFGIQSDESRPGPFRTGDYWLIPARTTTRTAKAGPDVEWPSAFLPPEGIYHFSPLAVLYYDESNRKITFKSDCREFFPSITSLPTSTNGFKVNSSLIDVTHTTVQDEKFKIIGPYFHGVGNVNGVPPAIILSETNAAY